MEPALKTRLIGAAVLVALAVIVVPMFFPGHGPETDHGKTVSLALPASPDQELTTRTMSVAPPAQSSSVASAAGTATGNASLATVEVPSRVPQVVQPGTAGPPAPKSTPTPTPTPEHEPAPAVPAKPAPQQAPPSAAPAPAKPAATADHAGPGQAAQDRFEVNLGAYSDSSNVSDLVRRVRKLGYTAHTDRVAASGTRVTRVTAGPFATRAAAEAARLRLKAGIPSAPARLVATTADQPGDAPASALAAQRAGGWAVQVGAYSSKADAQAQAAKLRDAGFEGYVDDVQSHGQTLWRVRAGPRTQRADAEALRDQIKSRLGRTGVIVTVP